jgi:hypothetical protein
MQHSMHHELKASRNPSASTVREMSRRASSLQARLHVERRAFECASINDEIADHRIFGSGSMIIDGVVFPTRQNRLAVTVTRTCRIA